MRPEIKGDLFCLWLGKLLTYVVKRNLKQLTQALRVLINCWIVLNFEKNQQDLLACLLIAFCVLCYDLSQNGLPDIQKAVLGLRIQRTN